MVNNVKVYGIEDSIKASKYPKSVSPKDCTEDITETVKKLASCKKGTGHDQFLTGISVSFDLTCSNKMWVELQRYHFVDFVSSQSTMHKIQHFDVKKQCIEYVDDVILNRFSELQKAYLNDKSDDNFYKLIYNIPSGFRLTARLITNYRALKTIYSQRKHHRLPEWQKFCDFIEKLPFAKEFIIGENLSDERCC